MCQFTGCPLNPPEGAHPWYLSHMNNGANLVQVYAVIGGWNYEGESFDSLCLFDCKSTAEAYYQQLTEVEGYDYARMEIKEVEMKSLLAA